MKKILLPLLLLFVLISACKEGEDTPESLKKGIIAKKQELRKTQKIIQSEIDSLEAKLLRLDPSSAKRKEKKRRLVTTSPIEKKDFKRFVEIQGGVQTDKTGTASSETGGRLTQLTVDEGDYVTQGQLIAVTDAEIINRNIDEIRKALELATQIYEKRDRLWKQGIGAEIEYLAAKNEKERLETSIITVQSQLSKINVYAPMTGIVDMVMVNQGEMAGPGTPIIRILSTGRVKVVADLPEVYLRSVKAGDWVTIQFPALDTERKAKISSIGRTINANNRTFQAEVMLSNPGGLLKPNLMALMLVKEFEAKNAVVLPTELIQQDVSGKDFVFIQSECEKGLCAKKVRIETGENYETETQIVSGLEGTEMIIMDGARSVADNELIKVLNAEPVIEENGKVGE